MRKFVFTLMFCCAMFAEVYGGVFPVLNTVGHGIEFVVASGDMTYSGDRSVFLASSMSLWSDTGTRYYYVDYLGITSTFTGNFISFSYVTKGQEQFDDGRWQSGAEARQMLFHPGGLSANYKGTTGSQTPTYGFLCSPELGLCLVDLNYSEDIHNGGDPAIIAKLGESGDARDYMYLTVFADFYYKREDVVVVTENGKPMKVFKIVSDGNHSAVRSVTVPDGEPSYFGINGQKYDGARQGVNIVVDGQETKKVVVK